MSNVDDSDAVVRAQERHVVDECDAVRVAEAVVAADDPRISRIRNIYDLKAPIPGRYKSQVIAHKYVMSRAGVDGADQLRSSRIRNIQDNESAIVVCNIRIRFG